MGLFRRKKKTAYECEAEVAPAIEQTQTPLPTKSKGPWDAKEDDVPAAPRIDWGALKIPHIAGMQMEVLPYGESQDRFSALNLYVGSTQVQLALFATRRSGGGWELMVEEIVEILRANDWVIEERQMPDGSPAIFTENKEPDATRLTQLITGVQGNGWFLRIIFRGAAATDAYARAAAISVIEGTVVDRGDMLLAPGECVPLVPRMGEAGPRESDRGPLDQTPPTHVGTGG